MRPITNILNIHKLTCAKYPLVLFTFHLSLFTLLLLLLSCDVRDPIYNTPHPGQGKVELTTGWKDIGQGITKPSTYTIETGTKTYQATSDTYSLPDLLAPGKYDIWLYNQADETAVKDGIATVTPLPSTGRADNYIHPMPGWLFTAKLVAEVQKDTDHRFDVPMKQQIRQLTLMITPEGSTINRIESITATLSGVAASWDLNAEVPAADPARVNLHFTRITEGENIGSWSTTVRLLGITGPSQQLSGTIRFSGSDLPDTPIDSDLTEKLTAFNTDKKTPLKLGGQVQVPTEAGFTATIVGWKEIYSSGTAQ